MGRVGAGPILLIASHLSFLLLIIIPLWVVSLPTWKDLVVMLRAEQAGL